MIHRSDGSGTPFNFADSLSKWSPEWKTRMGADLPLNWPVGTGARGNDDKGAQDAAALGYVPLPLELVDQIKGYWRRSFAAGLSFFLTRQGDQQERPSSRICGCRK